MNKKILTTILILGISAGEFSCLSSTCYARMTRKEKKETYLLNAGNAGLESQKYDIAIEFYTKVIELNPQNAEAYAKRGNAKYLSANYKEAVKDYTKALEIDPNRENAYYNRALAKSNLKKASEQGIEEATQLLDVIKKEENTKK